MVRYTATTVYPLHGQITAKKRQCGVLYHELEGSCFTHQRMSSGVVGRTHDGGCARCDAVAVHSVVVVVVSCRSTRLTAATSASYPVRGGGACRAVCGRRCH